MFWFQRQGKNDVYTDITQEALLAKNAEIIDIWEKFRDRFSEQGYTLYRLYGIVCQPLNKTDDDILKWSGAGREDEPPEWPYAYYGGDTLFEVPHPFQATLTKKICFAQDLQGRHVAIKRLEVLEDTEEIRINRWLYEHKAEAEKNCILPIIDIVEYDGQTFAIMPRWGESPCDLHSIGEIMKFIHCLLTAVNFLHKHWIIHRDLTENNILVNHFGCYGRTRFGNWLRPILLSEGKLTFAVFDFDLSLMLSSEERRLPSWRSFETTNITRPNDTHQGELDYDPFLFEMGCIGIDLCIYFQHCIPTVPMLAPFLDSLITDNLDRRFTSAQALDFFEKMYEELTPSQLATSVTPRQYIKVWESREYNRWKGLPDEFVRKWGYLRAPIPSMYVRTLRWLCTTYWGIRFVTYVRQTIVALKTYLC